MPASESPRRLLLFATIHPLALSASYATRVNPNGRQARRSIIRRPFCIIVAIIDDLMRWFLAFEGDLHTNTRQSYCLYLSYLDTQQAGYQQLIVIVILAYIYLFGSTTSRCHPSNRNPRGQSRHPPLDLLTKTPPSSLLRLPPRLQPMASRTKPIFVKHLSVVGPLVDAVLLGV